MDILMDILNDRIDWFVDIEKVLFPRNYSGFTPQKYAAYAKLAMFDMLIDINKHLDHKFTDESIANIVNASYKNALVLSRLGMHGYDWKYAEELNECMSALDAKNNFMKSTIDKHHPCDSSVIRMCDENIFRELASAMNMLIKCTFEFDALSFNPKLGKYYMSLNSDFKTIFIKLLNVIEDSQYKFEKAYISEYKEFAKSVEDFDTACDVINGAKVSSINDTVKYILSLRTPELISFARNLYNKNKLDNKIIKELRLLNRVGGISNE